MQQWKSGFHGLNLSEIKFIFVCEADLFSTLSVTYKL